MPPSPVSWSSQRPRCCATAERRCTAQKCLAAVRHRCSPRNFQLASPSLYISGYWLIIVQWIFDKVQIDILVQEHHFWLWKFRIKLFWSSLLQFCWNHLYPCRQFLNHSSGLDKSWSLRILYPTCWISGVPFTVKIFNWNTLLIGRVFQHHDDGQLYSLEQVCRHRCADCIHLSRYVQTGGR